MNLRNTTNVAVLMIGKWHMFSFWVFDLPF
jgi:hypothetical protein